MNTIKCNNQTLYIHTLIMCSSMQISMNVHKVLITAIKDAPIQLGLSHVPVVLDTGLLAMAEAATVSLNLSNFCSLTHYVYVVHSL